MFVFTSEGSGVILRCLKWHISVYRINMKEGVCARVSAYASARVGTVCVRGWWCARRGSVRMISEGVSTRMCASASRSPPAVTVTLGARTPPPAGPVPAVTAQPVVAGVLLTALVPAAPPPAGLAPPAPALVTVSASFVVLELCRAQPSLSIFHLHRYPRWRHIR